MKESEKARELSLDQAEQVSGGAYVPGAYKAEALAFLKECLGDARFNRILGNESNRRHPYVAARVFLSDADWDKYVWIERNGSLDGFWG